MKSKIVLFLMMCLLLIGCGNDSQYIEAAKSIQLNQTLEINSLKINTTGELAALFIHNMTKDDYNTILKSMTYKIEGSMGDNTKMVVANYKGAKVNIPVEKKGDYYGIEPVQMKGSYKDMRYGFPQLIQDVFQQELEKNLNNIFE